MLRATILILALLIDFLAAFQAVNAVACKPRWNGTRTVEATCDFPSSARVYGDIIVGPYTVTVPNGVVMGINLTTQKMTFSTGKVLFTGSARSDASVSNGYYLTISYTAGTTNCPAGLRALLGSAPQSAFAAGTLTTAPATGTLYCGYQ